MKGKVKACEICGGTTYSKFCGLCARMMVLILRDSMASIDRRYR
jgi:hypothetical protein